MIASELAPYPGLLPTASEAGEVTPEVEQQRALVKKW